MGVWRERLTRQAERFFLVLGPGPKGNALIMIILPLLLALSLQHAPAQKAPARKAPAPKAARAPAEKPVDPVKADSASILYAPSRSLRSATAAAADLPAAPVTVQFECLVSTDTGTPDHCFPLESGAKPATTAAEAEKRAAAWPRGAASPAVSVALQRVLFTRVRPSAEPGKPTPPVLTMFSETVSAGDVTTLGKSLGTMSASDIEMDERPDANVLAAYYPAAALHAGIAARVGASCRVMPDRKLFCHDADLIGADSSITPEMGSDFRNAAYQVLDAIRLAPLSKTGDPVVGRDVDMRISFVVPG